MTIEVSTLNSPVSSTVAAKRSAYLTQLLTLAQQAPIVEGLRELRDHGSLRVQEQHFPTTRDEEWRFTDLSDLLQIPLESVSTPQAVTLDDLADFLLPEAKGSRLVFVDGVYAPDLSATAHLPKELVVGNLAAIGYGDRTAPYLGKQSGAEEVFTALNTAGLADTAVVMAPRNLVVEPPIHLLFVATAQANLLRQPRCLVVAAPNSQLTVVEAFVSLGDRAGLTNSVTEIWVEENARVHHTRVQQESLQAFHIGKTAVSQARDSRYTHQAITIGAKLSRHNLEIYQTGEQTETILQGLAMIKEEQTADTHSTIALSKPYSSSRQLHKCIIDDRAHAVFNGKVFVPQAAQLTDAGQINRNLLLSPKARVDTKPQLEIVADNVKCTHGATVSQLDQDEVFYLQSRGIDQASSQTLLVYAFAQELIGQIPLSSLQERLSRWVHLNFAKTR